MVSSLGTDCFHSLSIIDILKKCTVGNVFTWTAQIVKMYTLLYHDGMNSRRSESFEFLDPSVALRFN